MLEADYRAVQGVFRHRVRLLGTDGLTLAEWDAVLLSASQDWPASPPVQEVSIERIHGRDCLLGVGRAGQAHWSLSVETLPIERVDASEAADSWDEPMVTSPFPSGRGLRFDVACRCPQQPTWLGSTYQTDAERRIRLETTASSRGVWCGTRMLRIEPVGLPEHWPGTVRWQYDLTADPAALSR